MTSLFGEIEGPAICDCGHPPRREANSVGTGYAISDGRTLCYDCSNYKELCDFLDSRRYTAYVSSEAVPVPWNGDLHKYQIRTWCGGPLAWVLGMSRTRRRSFDDGWLSSIRAMDENGWVWVGLGKPGFVVKLRKTQRRISLLLPKFMQKAKDACYHAGDPRRLVE